MSPTEIAFWRTVSEDLGIEVVAPFHLLMADGSQLTATALVKQFGAKNGMVVDADYAVLEPHTQSLVANSYGYSAISSRDAQLYERTNLIEALADWGWSGAADQKPSWLPEISN